MKFTINSKTRVKSQNDLKDKSNNYTFSSSLSNHVEKKKSKENESSVVINSYASKNPKLFGTGKVSSSSVKKLEEAKINASKAPIGSMFLRIKGLKAGCSACSGKK